MHQQESFLGFIFNALGTRYTILLPCSALIAFGLSLYFVIRGRGPFAAAGLVLAVHLPMLVGALSYIDGMIASYIVSANSNMSPKLSELAFGASAAFVGPLVSMFLTGPSYLAALIGSAIRAFLEPARSN